jgi:hypothetical protein
MYQHSTAMVIGCGVFRELSSLQLSNYVPVLRLLLVKQAKNVDCRLCNVRLATNPKSFSEARSALKIWRSPLKVPRPELRKVKS